VVVEAVQIPAPLARDSPVPINAVLFPSFPSLILFGAVVVSYSDDTLHVELNFLAGQRARTHVCIPFLPSSLSVHNALGAVVIFLDPIRDRIGSRSRSRESVMVTLLGTLPIRVVRWPLHSNST
jgi:hypothetical protein